MAKLGTKITSSQTIIPVFGYVNSAELPSSGIITIESESIKYTNTTDKELIGCTRGYNGSSAAAHDQDTDIELVLDLAALNAALPHITEDQRDAFADATAGLMIYNTDTDKLNLFNGTTWEVVTSA